MIATLRAYGLTGWPLAGKLVIGLVVWGLPVLALFAAAGIFGDPA